MEKTITFTYERDTKNKYRFQEDSEEPLVGTLYVSKTVFDSRPGKVEVTIKELK